jgi:hypothetical protein
MGDKMEIKVEEGDSAISAVERGQEVGEGQSLDFTSAKIKEETPEPFINVDSCVKFICSNGSVTIDSKIVSKSSDFMKSLLVDEKIKDDFGNNIILVPDWRSDLVELVFRRSQDNLVRFSISSTT